MCRSNAVLLSERESGRSEYRRRRRVQEGTAERRWTRSAPKFEPAMSPKHGFSDVAGPQRVASRQRFGSPVDGVAGVAGVAAGAVAGVAAAVAVAVAGVVVAGVAAVVAAVV